MGQYLEIMDKKMETTIMGYVGVTWDDGKENES